MTTTLNLLSALAAFAAAALWFWASRAELLSDYTNEIPDGVVYLTFAGGRNPIQITKTGKRVDVIATLGRQGQLNSWAAGAAAIAALLQGIALSLT